jgi:uncharacterized protein (UPF0210 family)
MRIRSFTLGMELRWPLRPAQLDTAAELCHRGRAALSAAGFEVQTLRLATPPFPDLVPADQLVEFTQSLEELGRQRGIDYFSIGPLGQPYLRRARYLEELSKALRSTATVFSAVTLLPPGGRVDLEAAWAAARIIRELAGGTELGFGNLRFAGLANVRPGTPFLPAAYHDGGSPKFSVALEAADVAVAAFEGPGTLDELANRLRASLEREAQRAEVVCQQFSEEAGVGFWGIDLSLAPFPEVSRSIGRALEALGVDRVGAPGTLFAASFITEVLSSVQVKRCGYSGLMLPVLEDAVLAQRAAEGFLTVEGLLSYSAVCGTGLDTIPLPGDVGEEELAGLLLDVAAMAWRLNKPLAARLMPIPGFKGGDLTSFTFEYFANSAVFPAKGYGAGGLLRRAQSRG